MSKFMQQLKRVVRPSVFPRSHDLYYNIPMDLDSAEGKKFVRSMQMSKDEIEREIQAFISNKKEEWPTNIVVDNAFYTYYIYAEQ